MIFSCMFMIYQSSVFIKTTHLAMSLSDDCPEEEMSKEERRLKAAQ